MYFNNTKEDTNIDKELRKKKKLNFKKINKKNFIIAGIIAAVLLIIIVIVIIYNNTTRYFLVLNGSNNITIYQGTTYNEPGYEAYDNKKNNMNYAVNVKSNLDSNIIGTYTITYSLYNKTKTRTIQVVAQPNVITVIHLKGDKNLYLNVGTPYNEPGYDAIDAVDGNLTNKVKINGNVDTSKKGTYRIIYSVVNSNGVTTSEMRTVIVQ